MHTNMKWGCDLHEMFRSVAALLTLNHGLPSGKILILEGNPLPEDCFPGTMGENLG